MAVPDRDDVTVTVGAVVTNVALHQVVPDGLQLPASLGAAGGLVAAARRAGVTWEQAGLSRHHALRSTAVGMAVAAPIVVALVAASRHPRTAGMFADDRVSSVSWSRAAYDLALRIPVATALGEEIVFRGVLPAVYERRHGTTAAVLASSVAFGLWHVLPSARNGPAAVATSIGVTALAGLGLSWLARRTGSIGAPTVVHAAVNITAFALARRSARQTS